MHLYHIQGVLTLSCAKVTQLLKLQHNKICRLKSSKNLLKAYLLRDAPISLTFNNCTLCPHCIFFFVCFVFISGQTATCATYSIN